MTDPRTREPQLPYRDLFPDHDLTPDERAAHDEDPRSGSCFGPDTGDSYLLSQADTDILEYVCNENEKDRAHMAK